MFDNCHDYFTEFSRQSVLDWYFATGDSKGFEQFVPDILSIVDLRIEDFLDPQLDIGWMGWDDRLGSGWCFHSNNDTCPQEAHYTLAALILKVIHDVANSLEYLEAYHSESRRYRQTYYELVKKFRLTVPGYPRSLGVHSAANAILSGVGSSEEIEFWLNSTLNNSITICSWSAFNQYWILQGFSAASAAVGDPRVEEIAFESALASIDQCWGNMIDMGKGCFFELSSPSWSSFRKDGDRLPTMPSLCHPWSSGVTVWLSKYLVGIYPTDPGYKSFVVAPFVSKKYPSIKGTVPTPHGSISVRATWLTVEDRSPNGGKSVWIQVNVTAPTNEVEPSMKTGSLMVGFSMMTNGCKLQSILKDSTGYAVKVWSPKTKNPILRRRSRMLRNKNKAWIGIEAHDRQRILSYRGVYECDMEAASISNTNINGPANYSQQQSYPATVIIDRSSRGNGLSKYGSDGYVLLGANPNSSDISRLPSYISNVSIFNHGFYGSQPITGTYVGKSKSDLTYLPDGSGYRVLGILGADSDTYWNPGIVFDVNLQGKYDQGILVDVAVASGSASNLASGHYKNASEASLNARNAKESVLVDLRTASDEKNNNNNTKEENPIKKNLLYDSVRSKSTFRISLYCVSTLENESFAIRPMDLNTLNVIAPTKMIDRHHEGVWWTMTYNSSVRLRIMGIYGMHISAIAFSRPNRREHDIVYSK